MVIEKLDYKAYKGRKYRAEIVSDRYLSIEPAGEGFDMKWVRSNEPLRMSIDDVMLSDWLDHPTAYGAFEGDKLIGFAEGFLEKWNNRYRISNICVFDSADRRSGVGGKLMETILEEAVRSGSRMAVLETQSFNFTAISFYKKNGFRIIGFDRYAYSNRGPEEHNMRIEMGRELRDRNAGGSLPLESNGDHFEEQKGKTVSLRAFTVQDTLSIRQKQYPEMPEAEIRSMIAEWETKSFQGKYFEMLAVTANGAVVGSASLMEHTKSVASIGVEVYPDERRKGYASEAMRRMMDRAGTLGYRVIQDQVRADNKASIALHNALGFETDGTRYKNRKGNEVLIYLICL